MRKHRATKLSRETDGSLGRKKLCGYRRYHSHKSKEPKHKTHFDYHGIVSRRYGYIDYF